MANVSSTHSVEWASSWLQSIDGANTG
jgi:hypothetical protein